MNYCLHISEQIKNGSFTNLNINGDLDFFVSYDLNRLYIKDDAIILLIDADTRVPENCIYETIHEFIQNPTLPYTQHYTIPFKNQNTNYWEQMISYFTTKIYANGLTISTALGEAAPLMGHNAFLRWSSIKQVSDGKTFWSEQAVSEDFDMFMRLASNNLFGRYVTYTGNGFEEGVSLTYIDEVIKIQKFTYGACEMCFNPFKLWITKGIISDSLKQYLRSQNIKWYQKIGLLVYISTFLALASSFYYVMMEAAFSIYYPDEYGKIMFWSFDIMSACLVIFGGFSTFADIVFHIRMKKPGLMKTIYENIKWIPVLSVFFGSLQFHMTLAALMYFTSQKVVWGATSKETVNETSFKAISTTMKRYWKMFIFMGLITGAYIYAIITYNIGVYHGWGLLYYGSVHLLGPFLLNPNVFNISFNSKRGTSVKPCLCIGVDVETPISPLRSVSAHSNLRGVLEPLSPESATFITPVILLTPRQRVWD